ncbi:hypothetical protein TcasGA2_TC011891 [Tribolium castaneum]|uniref:Uncharacterized protein n=1 Tax=Tribolium castaneum TaxID=7070 RepID=D6WZ67_TRICA|nr:hypothetical protein TcasGA2_TC011891 [Tribolium castaneum]
MNQRAWHCPGNLSRRGENRKFSKVDRKGGRRPPPNFLTGVILWTVLLGSTDWGNLFTQNGNKTLAIKADKLAAIYSGCKTGRVCVLFGSNRCFDALAVCLRRLLLLSPIAMATERLFYNRCYHGFGSTIPKKSESISLKKNPPRSIRKLGNQERRLCLLAPQGL